MTDPANPPNYGPPHTVLILELKTDGIGNEKWIIDATGCQYGFRDVLVPFDKYFEEKACHDLKRSHPYDANETKDIDYFLTLPFMAATSQQRNTLMGQRAARLHFAAFVKTCIDKGGAVSNNYVLSGSTADFQTKLNVFVRDLKDHMTEFVEKNLRKDGFCKKG